MKSKMGMKYNKFKNVQVSSRFQIWVYGVWGYEPIEYYLLNAKEKEQINTA